MQHVWLLFSKFTHRLRPFFDESIAGQRRIALLLYAIVGPVFLVTYVVQDGIHSENMTHLYILIFLFGSAFVWLFIRRNPQNIDWIYSVSLSPVICCGIAFSAHNQTGFAFLAVISAPSIWASILFPSSCIALTALITAIVTCFFSVYFITGSISVAITNTVLFGLVTGLVVVLIFQKAKELRETTQRLLDKDSRWRSLFSAMKEGVISRDAKGTIVECNKSARDIFGVLPEQVIGKRVIGEGFNWFREDGSVFTEEEHPAIVALTSGIPVQDVIVGVEKLNGERFWLRINAEPVFTHGTQSPTAVITSFHDITKQRVADEALRESNERFRQLAEIFPETIFEVDLASKISYLNKQGIEQFRFNGEIKDQNLMTFVRPEDREIVMKRIMERLSGKIDGYTEYQALRSDGSRFHALAYTAPMYTNGQLVGIRGFILDITDRKKTENQLRESLAFQNLLIESIEVGVVIIDINTRCIETINRKGLQLFGNVSIEKVTGHVCHNFICPREAGQCPIVDLGLEGNNSEGELLMANGRTLPIIKSVKQITIDGKLKLLETFIDISERKIAENTIKESELKYRLLIENAPSAFTVHQMIFDEHGNPVDYIFSSANPAFETHTGLRVEDVMGRRVTDVLPGIEKTPFLKIYGDVVITGKPVSFDQFSEPLGRYYHVNAYHVGKNHFATIFTDITEKRKIEENLKLSREQFELAVRGSNDGIWDWNLRTNTLYLSPRWKELLGYLDNELSNEFSTFQRLVHEQDWPDLGVAVDHYLKGHLEKYEYEFRMLHRDGSFRWILARGEAFRDEFGIPYRMAGSHTDITDRKLVENALRDSEQNFRTFFDTIGDLIFVANAQGHIFFTNPSVTIHLGYTSEELNSMHVLDVHPKNRRTEAEIIFTEMFGGKRDTCPLPLERKDGTFLPVETRVWFGKWNGSECIFGLSKNLTAQQEAQVRFERLFRGNPSPMVLSELPSRTFVDVNEAFLELFGYGKDEVIGKSAADLMLVVDIEKQVEISRQLALNGSIHDMELKVRCKDGALRDGLFSGEVISSYGKLMFLTVMVDITDIRNAELELRQKSEELERYFTSSLDLLCIADMDGRFVKLNPEWEKVLGFSTEELEGKKFIDFVHSDDVERTIAVNSDLKNQRDVVSFENRYLCKDGGYRWIEWRSRPEGTMIYAAARDITDRKNTEIKLRELNQHLEQQTLRANELATKAEGASKAKSIFLATMSHEIRTPLNGVVGMTDLLLESELDATQRNFAEIIKSSSDSLISLINDILDYSKIEAGKIEFSNVQFNIKDFLNTSFIGFEFQARKKTLTLQFTVGHHVPLTIIGDPHRLRQVLTNLIGNAIKFTKEGTIALLCSLEEKTDESCVLRFEITDSGIGIEKEKQSLLFNSFTQADPGVTRKYGGTGLGLAISKRLVEMMDGSIGLVSEAGDGATFWFTARFGIQKSGAFTENDFVLLSSVSGTKKQKPEMGQVSHVRILLAEDNIVNQEVALGMLRTLGFSSIKVCNTGAEAIRELEKNEYDLVLMDMQMPEMDGVQATQIIRDKNSNVRQHDNLIIAMTANASSNDRELCLREGMNDFLAKPVEMADLRDMVVRWLPKSSTHAIATEQSRSSHPDDKKSDTVAIFDYDCLVGRLMGDTDFVRKVLDIFVDDIPKQLNTLKTHNFNNDVKNVEIVAHTIKGAASNVCLEQLRRIAAQIETDCRKGNMILVTQAMMELETQVQSAISEIRKKLDG